MLCVFRRTALVLLALTAHGPPVWAQLPATDGAVGEGSGEVIATRTLDHSLWDAVLAAHVNSAGEVDFQSLLDSPGDLQRLDDYLLGLQTAVLQRISEQERVAFWINAYNAIALRAALEAFPIESVRNVPAFFIQDRQIVAGSTVGLNDIENDRLRHPVTEPRIHFALSPLARGAPPLRREAYTGAELDAQLDEQARAYVLATTRVRPNLMEIEVSRLFEWFSHDFDAVGGVRTFVAQHLPADLARHLHNETLVFVYTDFDWRLNAATEE